MKIKRQNKAAVEAELAKAMERLEIEDSTADQLKKSHLTLRRAMQKVSLLFSFLYIGMTIDECVCVGDRWIERSWRTLKIGIFIHSFSPHSSPSLQINTARIISLFPPIPLVP